MRKKNGVLEGLGGVVVALVVAASALVYTRLLRGTTDGTSGLRQISLRAELLWPLQHHQLWLLVLPVAEGLALFGLLGWLIWRSTSRELKAREEWAWLGNESLAPSEEEVAQITWGLANMPVEPYARWLYGAALTTRVALVAHGDGKVLVTISVPRERAGETIRSATDLANAELRPLAEFVLPREERAAEPVPVGEVPDIDV